MKTLLNLLIICITISIFGCSPRYAVVSINSVDATDNTSITSTRVYSGKDGLFLGYTPSLNYLIKTYKRKKVTMSLIVEANCYETEWRIIEITNWANNTLDAHDASKVNRVLFILKPFNCNP